MSWIGTSKNKKILKTSESCSWKQILINEIARRDFLAEYPSYYIINTKIILTLWLLLKNLKQILNMLMDSHVGYLVIATGYSIIASALNQFVVLYKKDIGCT